VPEFSIFSIGVTFALTDAFGKPSAPITRTIDNPLLNQRKEDQNESKKSRVPKL
jgi:hypothetical protein